MNKTIAVLPGDGIGPEVIAQSLKVLKVIENKFQHRFECTEAPIGAAAMAQGLEPLPPATLELCQKADAVLFGAIGDPRYDKDPGTVFKPEQGLLDLRKSMGFFANIRPIKSYRKLAALSPLKEEQVHSINLILFRELTAGLYFGKKQKDEEGRWAIDECYYHQEEIERISHLAFRQARLRKKKLTLVDKANVLETGKLWRSTVQNLHKSDYPDVELELMLIDHAAMQLVLNPRQFDVILTENMFGDILSDEASVVVGTIGLLPSASLNENQGLFEPIHGSYPQAAGRNLANPIASILSVAMMLDFFDLTAEAGLIREAVDFLINEGLGTMDMAPRTIITCSAMGEFVSGLVASDKSSWPSMRKSLDKTV
ncbi:MAG TPA: 3-isopropylmalate dehydrogenase [Saprospiraceae bacterium]|nr:3-isopropylmalate dehydrogenase [Saprospiraceae bacterium]HNT18915.1 3-isopropylmalate dehydrogenase [Saprospiraceae bacterium]